MELRSYADSEIIEFMTAARTVWRQRPVTSNLPWGLAERYQAEGKPLNKMITLSDGGETKYVGLQTDADRPLILVGPAPFPPAAKQLLRPILENAAGFCGEFELARSLQDLFPAPQKKWDQMYLYQLEKLAKIAPRKGHLRRPGPEHANLIAAWIKKFLIDVNMIGGNTDFHQQAKDMIRKSNLRLLLKDGEVVSMAASTRNAGGVACINYVYTPPRHRSNGFAFRCVGLYCRELLQANEYCCLYAEEENPISNRVYQKLGFEILERSVEVEW